jgi:hypothetical protein
MAKETPFELAKKEVYAGNLKAPSVSAGTERGIIQVPYFRYQLACHKMAISLLTKGIKLTRNAPPLKHYKEYYGLKGKTATDCLVEFQKIFDDYEKELVGSN